MGKAVEMYALKEGFRKKVKKSNNISYDVRCKDENYKFQLVTIKTKIGDQWEVPIFRKQLCCSLDSVHRRCRKVSAKLIRDLITLKLQVSGQSMKPKEIQAEIQVNYGVTLPYNQCRRAKDHAEDNDFGSAELSFEQLPAYCYQLELANPGTVTNIETNDSNQFLYMFIAYGVSISGFRQVIRPIIAIDETHLKGKFGGIIFIAACKDANEQVYPLAFGFGDVEDEKSWSWFLTKLLLVIVVSYADIKL